MNPNSDIFTESEYDPWNNDSLLKNWVKLRFTVINCPAVIISQLQRSGGTLLTQLLDGHHQLYVHPSELHIGRPNKYYWPSLNLRLKTEDIFSELWEHTTLKHSLDGYSKTQSKVKSHRFLFSGGTQKEIFSLLLENRKNKNTRITQRDVLDDYMTSFFNSWYDYEDLDKSKRYWVSFVARALTYRQNINAFFYDYPNGKIIHILRDPQSWYASASKYMPNQYGDCNQSMRIWCDHAYMMEANNKDNENVLMILFEDLLKNPKEIMQLLCQFIGIEYCKEVMTPTFNKKHVLSNSSFVDTRGIISNLPLTRKLDLSEDELKTIHQEAMPVYAKIKQQISL